MKRPPLTPKQARFVEEYGLDHNGSAAAVRAGFAPGSSRVTASRLLQKLSVRAAVAALEAEAAKQLNVTREGVLAALHKAYEDARAQDNPMVMVVAARELAKVCGFYAEQRVAVEVPSVATKALEERLSRMSDAELEAIMAAGEP